MEKRVLKKIGITIGVILATLVVFVMLLMAITSSGATSRGEVVRIYEKNEAILSEAIQSGTVVNLNDLENVQNITVCDWSDCIIYRCGTSGIVSAGSEYGFYYSPSDSLTGAFTYWEDDADTTADGAGVRFEDAGNHYYVESIGPHFFYYKASY